MPRHPLQQRQRCSSLCLTTLIGSSALCGPAKLLVMAIGAMSFRSYSKRTSFSLTQAACFAKKRLSAASSLRPAACTSLAPADNACACVCCRCSSSRMIEDTSLLDAAAEMQCHTCSGATIDKRSSPELHLHEDLMVFNCHKLRLCLSWSLESRTCACFIRPLLLQGFCTAIWGRPAN